MGRLERSIKKKNEGASVGLNKGPWTPQEDQKLLSCIQQFGQGSWRSLSAKAGLKRCGKSCRLRWNNYLRPGIKKGTFSLEEEQTIIQLHALLGNRWSAIAAHLPRRTDSRIKNHWNSHIKKRLAKMGIDPVTHKPKVDTVHLHSSNVSHMIQWEGARLEAEARLVQHAKHYPCKQPYNLVSQPPTHEIPKMPTPQYSQCLDVLQIWQGATLSSNYLMNGGRQIPNYSTSSTFLKDFPFIITSNPMMSYDESNGLVDQRVNTRLHDKTEILMDPFEEVLHPNDANWATTDPLIISFLEGCVSSAENYEAVNDGWSNRSQQ